MILISEYSAPAAENPSAAVLEHHGVVLGEFKPDEHKAITFGYAVTYPEEMPVPAL